MTKNVWNGCDGSLACDRREARCFFSIDSFCAVVQFGYRYYSCAQLLLTGLADGGEGVEDRLDSVYWKVARETKKCGHPWLSGLPITVKGETGLKPETRVGGQTPFSPVFPVQFQSNFNWEICFTSSSKCLEQSLNKPKAAPTLQKRFSYIFIWSSRGDNATMFSHLSVPSFSAVA